MSNTLKELKLGFMSNKYYDLYYLNDMIMNQVNKEWFNAKWFEGLLEEEDVDDEYPDMAIFKNQCKKYTEQIETLIIQEPIETIDFYNYNFFLLPKYVIQKEISKIFQNLKYIEFPDSLLYITTLSFPDCKNLETLRFNDKLKKIGTLAFIRGGVKNITFNEGLTIDDSAFTQCNNLTSLEFPPNVTIGKNAFRKCHGLKRVVFMSKNIHIENESFWDCKNLNHFILPSSDMHIGNGAFDTHSNYTYLLCEQGKLSLEQCMHMFNILDSNNKHRMPIVLHENIDIYEEYINNVNHKKIYNFQTIVNDKLYIDMRGFNFSHVKFPQMTFKRVIFDKTTNFKGADLSKIIYSDDMVTQFKKTNIHEAIKQPDQNIRENIINKSLVNKYNEPGVGHLINSFLKPPVGGRLKLQHSKSTLKKKAKMKVKKTLKPKKKTKRT